MLSYDLPFREKLCKEVSVTITVKKRYKFILHLNDHYYRSTEKVSLTGYNPIFRFPSLQKYMICFMNVTDRLFLLFTFWHITLLYREGVYASIKTFFLRIIPLFFSKIGKYYPLLQRLKEGNTSLSSRV